MNPPPSAEQSRRIAFVSTRIQGTDGVSLEIGKWAVVLERMGHFCFYISGESDRAAQVSEVIPEAHFKHPDIQEINRQCFAGEIRTRALTDTARCEQMVEHNYRVAKQYFSYDRVETMTCSS